MSARIVAQAFKPNSSVKAALSTAGRAISSTRATGEAGKGLVRATLAGDGRIVNLHVSPSIGKEGPKAIEKLVAAAVNRAHDRLKEVTRKQLQSSLPPNVDAAMVLRALP